jgi:glycosyltransferase involved in cell wall biosynthesis
LLRLSEYYVWFSDKIPQICDRQTKFSDWLMKISVTIITYNEAKNIKKAIESVSWADEILIMDSESTDETREIAEKSGAKVCVQKWLGFAKQKQLAMDKAEFDWIFSLDADEQVSEELKNEILALKRENETVLADGYKIPRRTWYMNRWICGGGWYPDWQLRFFNRTKAKWKDVAIHESVQMAENAKIKTLKGDILHYSIPDAAYHHRLIGERYAPLAARQMFENGRKTSPYKIVAAGFSAFFQTYLLKGGFRDGLAGFCIARFAAHHAFLKHLLLWELQNSTDKCSDSRL